MSRKVQIVLGTTSMEVTAEPIANNATELFAKQNIVEVIPVKRQVKPNNYSLGYTAPSGNFTLGETVTGGTSGATGTISRFDGTTRFAITNAVGVFVAGETITGATSTRTATVTTVSQRTFPEEWQYDKPVMTIICVVLQNNIKFDIELQDVTNQPTWNTGTLAAQQQAISDINGWL